jgi:hypothetical protein
VVGQPGVHGVGRHRRVEGLGRVLDDDRPSQPLDRPEPADAVVERAREDHASHTALVTHRRRPEQGVDRRPVPVLSQPVFEPHRAVLEQQVVVGRRDVDVPVLDRGAVVGVLGGQLSGPRQDRGQDARRRRNVQHDEQRSGEIPGEAGGQGAQRLDTAGGGSDDDDVPSGRLVPSPHLVPSSRGLR